MTAFRNNFSADTQKIQNGTPVAYPANEDGTIPVIYVTRMDDTNREYAKALKAAMKPYQREIELKILSDDKDHEIFLDVFSNAIVRGWDNVQDDMGAPIDFNQQNVKTLFTKYPDALRPARTAAQDETNFRLARLETQAKN